MNAPLQASNPALPLGKINDNQSGDIRFTFPWNRFAQILDRYRRNRHSVETVQSSRDLRHLLILQHAIAIATIYLLLPS